MTDSIEPQGYISVSEKYKIARIKQDILREIKSFHIPYVADAKTVLLFDPKATPQEILDSLEVLRRDLQLRIKKSHEEE